MGSATPLDERGEEVDTAKQSIAERTQIPNSIGK